VLLSHHGVDPGVASRGHDVDGVFEVSAREPLLREDLSHLLAFTFRDGLDVVFLLSAQSCPSLRFGTGTEVVPGRHAEAVGEQVRHVHDHHHARGEAGADIPSGHCERRHRAVDRAEHERLEVARAWVRAEAAVDRLGRVLRSEVLHPTDGGGAAGRPPGTKVTARRVGTLRGVAGTRVFLLDDHEIVRRGVRELIDAEDDLEVVGEAGTAEQALARVPATRPDVAVLDVRLPDRSGIEVCRDLRSSHPELACLMLTSFSDDEALIQAVMAGASGYLLKQIRGTDIVAAIRAVASGRSLLDPALAEQAAARLRRGPEEDERLAHLTHQEKRILELIAEGLTNRQIADEMHLAEKTVKNYVSNLLSKLGMERRTQAAVFAARLEQDSSGTRPSAD
jgi:two-component system, NarL family, response regulator DevR